MADIQVNIASVFTGKKAFQDAAKQTLSLNNQVKTLAKSYLGLFTVQRLGRASYNAAKAFAEDDAAAQRLANSVKNLGLAYANDDIRKYVDSLTIATGVADSKLRPALQSLLQVTGSLTKSQELLSTAIDVSRGTGEELTSVANDLSQAYVGNTKGLRKYQLGLTQAELKGKSFADIQDRINSLFSGASAAYLKTYAGQMELLTTRAKEAQEAIGKGLVDALVLLGGDKGIEGAADGMDTLVEYTNDAIYGMAVLADKINNLPIVGGLGLRELIGAIPLIGGYLNLLADTGRSAKAAKNTFNFAAGGGAGAGSTSAIEARQAAAAEKLAKKRQQEILKAQKEQLKITKEQTALQKAGTLFDLQQTQIIAALKGDISAEERKRLELQLAILTGNTTEASKLAGELAKSQGLSQQLAAYLASLPDAKNPFTAWKSYLDMIESQVARIAVGNVQAAPTSMATGYGVTGQQYSLPMGATVATAAGPDITVNVNAGTVIAEEGLKDVIRDSLLNDSLQAKFAAIYRQGGSFGA